MAVYDNYSDEQCLLYENIRWAILGEISTVNPSRSKSFYGFLDDLFDEQGGYINGELGWTIERIKLINKTILKNYFLKDNELEVAEKLMSDGEQDIFWVESNYFELNKAVLSAASFWSVVNDSFNEFVAKNPERTLEFEAALCLYPQLKKY